MPRRLASFLLFSKAPHSFRELLHGSAGALRGSARSCLNSRRYHLGSVRTHKGERQIPHRIPAALDRLSRILSLLSEIRITIGTEREGPSRRRLDERPIRYAFSSAKS